MRRSLVWMIPVIAGLVIGTFASVALPAGGSRGAELYHTTKPACVACHNPRRGSLAKSRLGRQEIKAWIRKGSPPEMPAYRLSEPDLEALAIYVEGLR